MHPSAVSAWFAAQQPAPVEPAEAQPPGAPDPVVPAPRTADESAARPWSTRVFATAADAGWRASKGPAVEPAEETTSAGLPKRRPRARSVPGTSASAGPPNRSAEDVRDRLASHQQGVRHGRQAQVHDNPEGEEGA
jgi:hypothetical protein